MKLRYRRFFAAVSAVVLIAAACSSNDDESSDGDGSPGDDVAASGLELVRGDIQELWVFDRIAAIELDGSETDITAKVVELAEEGVGDPVDITSGSTFAPSSSMTPEMIDPSGAVLNTVDLVGGVMETSDGTRSLAVLATPDHGEWIIGAGNTVLLDLPEEAGVTQGTPMVFDFVYAQYLPVEGAERLDDDQTPVELWQERAGLGAIAYVDDGAGNSALITGEIGQAMTLGDDGVAFLQSGDDLTDEVTNYANDKLIDKITDEVIAKGGYPAGSEHLIKGIIEGAKKTLPGKCRSATCIKDLTDEIEKGFEESLKEIEDQLEIDPDLDPDPDPDPDPPPTTNNTTTTTPRTTTTTTPTTTIPPTTTSSTTTTTCAGCPPPPGTPPGGGGPGGGGPGGGGPGGGGPGGGGGGGGGTQNDPHVYPFDGDNYSFQYIGEYTLARSGDLEVQVRYEPLACDCLASVGTATAVSDGETRVQISAVEPHRLLIDGELVELEAGTLAAGDLTVERTGSGYSVTAPDGTVVRASLATWRGASILNTWVAVPYNGAWSGMLGNANGKPGDDFVTRDGADLGPIARGVDWDRFADSWRITDDMSLFEYFPGQSAAFFADAEYPVPHPEISSEDLAADREARGPQADAVCRASGLTDPAILEDCIFDFTVTGSSLVVQASRQGEIMLGRYDGFVGDGDTGEKSDGAAGAAQLDGLKLAEESGYPHVTGDGLVLVRALDGDDTGILAAVDAATHEVRWSVSDIDIDLAPAVIDGLGVVVRLAADPEAEDDKTRALAVLSSQNGSEVVRYEAEDVDGGVMIGSHGDTFVFQRSRTLRAFTVTAEGITPVWDRGVEHGARSIVVDDHVVAEMVREGDFATFEALDITTGEVSSSVDVDGDHLTRMIPVGDDMFTVSMEGGGPEVLALVEIDAGQLNRRWMLEQDPDEIYFPDYFVDAGDVITGWTKHQVGGSDARGPVGFDKDDGEIVWTYTMTSFDNNGGLLGASDDFVVSSSMAGAWLEVIDASDGSGVEILDENPSGLGGGPRRYTPLDDGTFMITVVTESGISFEFISPGG